MPPRKLKEGERTIQVTFFVPKPLFESIRAAALVEEKSDSQLIRETMEKRFPEKKNAEAKD